MRHAKKKLQLNRFTSWHKATLASLARSIFIYQSIRTTLHKAKAVKPLIDKMITQAKTGTLSAKRAAFKVLCDHKLVSILFKEIAPRFANRPSGYTRIIPLGRRRGDNAQVVILELMEIKKKEVKKPKKEKEAKPREAPEATEVKGKPTEKQKPESPVAVKEKPPIIKKPTKNFLGGLKNIFKKERDSL